MSDTLKPPEMHLLSYWSSLDAAGVALHVPPSRLRVVTLRFTAVINTSAFSITPLLHPPGDGAERLAADAGVAHSLSSSVFVSGLPLASLRHLHLHLADIVTSCPLRLFASTTN